MSYQKRTDEWVSKFLKHIEQNHPDLFQYFYGQIFFSPSVDNPAILYATYTPVDDTPELKKVRDRMFHVFESFYQQNPV